MAALIKERFMANITMRILDVHRPLERDDLIRTRTRVQRQSGVESLNVKEPEGIPDLRGQCGKLRADVRPLIDHTVPYTSLDGA